MLRTKTKAVLFVILILSAFTAEAQTDRPPSKFKFGFSERFRFKSWDNVYDLNDSLNDGSTFTRHRTSGQLQWFPRNGLEFAIKLTNEFRFYFVPSNKEFTFHEIIFDQLYLKSRLGKIIPGTLTLGRFNMILGEGLAIMDGQPLDGSRSIFFNGGRFDWMISPADNLTFFYVWQNKTDDILPVINDQSFTVIEHNYHGGGLYYTGSLKKTKIESYFIYKKTEADKSLSEYYTLGTRLIYPLSEKVSVNGEGAYQFGHSRTASQGAWGWHVHLDYKTGWCSCLPEKFVFGSVYFSGDDRTSAGRDEGWDPLFARWPKWSESYIYTQLNEKGIAWWTNLASLYGQAHCRFSEKVSLGLEYHHLLAPEIIGPLPENDSLFCYGHHRGDLLIARMNFKIEKNLTGHLLWELFTPGSFYRCTADGYSWARIEFLYQI